MRWLGTAKHTLRSLFRRRAAENELSQELEDHLRQEIESNLRFGMPPEEARLAALRLIGPIALHQEECREWRGTAFLETTARDLRYGVQMLRRTPLFSVAAILMLALGIGANTTVFTFVENILLRPVPVRDPQQLAFLNWGGMVNIAYPNYADLRDRNQVFSSLVAYRYNPVSLSIQKRENYRVWGYEATGNYFETLGVQAALGRFFGPSDDNRSNAHAVLVIGNRLWRTRRKCSPTMNRSAFGSR